MSAAARLPLALALASLLLSAAACSPTPDAGPSGDGDKADSLLTCPAHVGLNSAEGSQRRCVNTDNGQFVATACCADVCAGADWREQQNGTFCAWVDEPGTPGAQVGQFAPRICCDLNERLSCEVAEVVGDTCQDASRGREVSAACCQSTPEACHPMVASELRACVDQVMEDNASDPESLPMLPSEALAVCASEGDLQGPMLDSLCQFHPDSEFCQVTMESFATQFVPACAGDLAPEYSCVFGPRYHEIFQSSRFVVAAHADLRLADAQALPAAEQSQILQALAQSALGQASDLNEAFDFVDDNRINQVRLWDGSNDQPFIAYEFGAGDNSFGAIFHADSGQLAARIIDGDIFDGSANAGLGCDISVGPGWKTCSENSDCSSGMRCEGRISGHPAQSSLGKCVDPLAGQGVPGNGDDCASAADCSFVDGLVCSGLTRSAGFCRPAWMSARFEARTSSLISAGGVVEQDIFVYGLGNTPEDAVIKFDISHTRVRDLNITVIPAGRDNASLATVFTGATDALPGQTSLSINANLFHPGDEDLNGRWTLHIENTGNGTGSVSGYELDFSSRFD